MALPNCFGIFWEDVAGSPDCQGCTAKGECLARFATETLVNHQRELGDKATVATLAGKTGVQPAAIEAAIAYQQIVVTQGDLVTDAPAVEVLDPVVPAPPDPVDGQMGLPAPAPAASSLVMDQDVPAPPEVPIPPSAPEPPAPGSAPETGDEPVAKKPPTKRKKNPPKTATKADEAPPAAEKKKRSPRIRKKGGAKATGVPPVNFPKAGAALCAAVPVKAARAVSAHPAKARERKTRSWGPEYNLERFKRERKRNPLVRMLPPGYALEREWPMGSGDIHRVVVGKRSYQYRKREFPTLYAVLQAITGTKEYPKQLRPDGSRPEGAKRSTSWSVTKFFSLKKIMLTLKEECQGKGKCKPPTKKPPSKRPGKKSPPKKPVKRPPKRSKRGVANCPKKRPPAK